MRIEPQYVPYNMAVLLKQKGFDVDCKSIYYNGSFRTLDNFFNNIYAHDSQATAPEIWVVIRWFKKVHNLCIYVEPTTLGDSSPFIKDSWGTLLYNPWENNNKGITYKNEWSQLFAIEYALNNLTPNHLTNKDYVKHNKNTSV